MVPMTAEHSRETLQKLITTRGAVANAPEDSFNQNRWAHKCGTPACTLGWATSASKGELEFIPGACNEPLIRHIPTNTRHVFAAQSFYRCSYTVADYICAPADSSAEARSAIDEKGPWPALIMDPECRNLTRDGALARLDLLINRERRRLATLEVEQGEWGPLRAKDAPVGRARDVAVQEKLEAVLV